MIEPRDGFSPASVSNPLRLEGDLDRCYTAAGYGGVSNPLRLEGDCFSIWSQIFHNAGF